MRYLMAFPVVLALGCRPAVKEEPKEEPGTITQAEADRILAQQVSVYDEMGEPYSLQLGMKEADVLAILGSFRCDRSNRTVTRFGTREQWSCKGKYGPKYLYFDDGVLAAAQE